MRRADFTGLEKRTTYEDIVMQIEGNRETIKYPNRVATQLMNSPYVKRIDEASKNGITTTRQ